MKFLWLISKTLWNHFDCPVSTAKNSCLTKQSKETFWFFSLQSTRNLMTSRGFERGKSQELHNQRKHLTGKLSNFLCFLFVFCFFFFSPHYVDWINTHPSEKFFLNSWLTVSDKKAFQNFTNKSFRLKTRFSNINSSLSKESCIDFVKTYKLLLGLSLTI